MQIRKMKSEDTEQVFRMMRTFYDSPAVHTKASDEVLRKDIADAVGACPYLDGFVLEEEGEIFGYGMTSLGYSTEFGGVCVWVEDLYLKEEARFKGYATLFFEAVEAYYPEAVRFRLEVERENFPAVASYRKNGYNACDYLEMTKER